MRHLIGRLLAGPTTEGRAGVARPRPCRRVVWGIAVSVLVHAALIALTWQAAPLRKPVAKEAARLSVRLVARAPQAAIAVPRPAAKAARPAPAKARTAKKIAAAPTKPAVADAPVAPAETIDGSVFALPHIGIGAGSPARWMKTHAVAASMPPPPWLPPQAMHAQGAREAGRMQIVLAMQQQVSAWQGPVDAPDGTCLLHARTEGTIECDNAALQQAIGAQAESLSGLLEAYRHLDPSAGSLSIAYQQGRYHVSLVGAAAQP